MSSYLERFMEAYKDTPPALGLTDIYSDDSPDIVARTAAFCFLMCQSTFQDGTGGVRKVMVIGPPSDSGVGLDPNELQESLKETVEAKFARSLTPPEIDRLQRFVQFRTTANLWQESVETLLSSAEKSIAIIVVRAALYRSADPDRIPIQATAPMLPEDIWVRHLYKLALDCSRYSQEKQSYILLDTGQPPPAKTSNKEALASIPKIGIFSWLRDQEPARFVAERIEAWMALVRDGQVGSAFKDIDDLPASMDQYKSFLKVQLIEAVAPGNELMKIIMSDERMMQADDPQAQLRIAKIAQRSHEYGFASSMVRRSLPELTHEGDLALAAELVYDLSEEDLIDQAIGRLDSLFPGSDFAADYRLRIFLHRRMFSEVFSVGAEALMKVAPERKFFFQTIAASLVCDGFIDYTPLLGAIRQATPQLVGWAITLCAKDALARGHNAQAVSVLLAAKELPQSSLVRTLIRAVRARLLERAPGGSNLTISDAELMTPIEVVIDYLALNPQDGEVRLLLTDLVSVETAGTKGLAVIVAIAAKRAQRTIVDTTLQKTPKVLDEDQSEKEMESIKRIFEWVSAESPIMLGQAKLPACLMDVPADDLLEIARYSLRSNEDLRKEEESKAFDGLLLVACLLAPHSSEPNEDMDLIRYAGARYRAANKAQKSRNLAEQALQLTREDVLRRRLAWLTFSDIYLRSLSTIEAVIGFACAVTNTSPVSPEQVFQEGYLQLRILRDLRLIEGAYELLDFLKGLCNDIGLGKRHQQRLKTVDFQLIAKDPWTRLDSDPDRLLRLTEELGEHCQELEDTGEESAPAIAMLAHFLNLAKTYGLQIDPATQEILSSRMAAIPAATAALLDALDPHTSTADQLLALGKTLEASINAEDVALDIRHVAIAARRFLDSELDGNNPAPTSFAIECLSDQSVKPSLVGTDQSLFTSVEVTAERALEMSRLGATLMQIGVSETGQLVRVSSCSGATEPIVREPLDIFSQEKFRKWTTRYPYGYAKENDPMNLFYSTLTGIGLSSAPSAPTVLVLDNSLHQMPPNLMMAGDHFSGSQQPMAMSPSVSWLWGARSVSTNLGKRLAWISTEQGDGRDAALATVAERAKECFEVYGFTANHSATIPEDMNDCEIAVVAAHGGVLPEGRYIQRVSDDARLAIYPQTLATALKGTSVVILFICSGGRFDSNPDAEASVGLVHQLLDAGCLTVIASPWPLDTRVPSHWLTEFMKWWSKGRPVIEANFRANQYVRTQMGDSPRDCLAMNVFGDPFRSGTSQ